MSTIVKFILILGCCSFLLPWAFSKKAPRTGRKIAITGNAQIPSFTVAKERGQEMYTEMGPSRARTFYCGCSFTGNEPDHTSCGYIPQNPQEHRAYRIEWEHIVPAHAFGQSFKAWREGHPDCTRKNKTSYKGRKCATKVSEEFNHMEGDLHNLVPEIGEINKIRSNLPMGMITRQDHISRFGECQTRIDGRMIEPRKEVRGFVARTYLYMETAYPGHGIISHKNRKLFLSWNKMYPPTAEEIDRTSRIAKIQGNDNVFVSEYTPILAQLSD